MLDKLAPELLQEILDFLFPRNSTVNTGTVEGRQAVLTLLLVLPRRLHGMLYSQIYAWPRFSSLAQTDRFLNAAYPKQHLREWKLGILSSRSAFNHASLVKFLSKKVEKWPLVAWQVICMPCCIVEDVLLNQYLMKTVTSRLKMVDLSESLGVTDLTLEILSVFAYPSLFHLNLAQCKKITDYGLAKLIICKKLSYLNINGCSRITKAGLSGLLESLPMLDNLYMRNCNFSRSDLKQLLFKISGRCGFKGLGVDSSSAIETSALEIDGLEHLQLGVELKLVKAIPMLQKLTGLRQLHLDCAINNQQLQKILISMPDLSVLHLDNGVDFNSETFSVILGLARRLKSLSLKNCLRCTGNSIDSLTSISPLNLHHFRVENAPILFAHLVKFVKFIEMTPFLKELQVLDHGSDYQNWYTPLIKHGFFIPKEPDNHIYINNVLLNEHELAHCRKNISTLLSLT